MFSGFSYVFTSSICYQSIVAYWLVNVSAAEKNFVDRPQT